jgi:hypothetical protein
MQFMMFVTPKMPSYILQVCILLSILHNWLIPVYSASVDVTKTIGFHEFEPVGNQVFYNAGHGSKKKLKDTGSKLENSILKSKIEALGEVLKKHVNSLRATNDKQVNCMIFLFLMTVKF